MIFSFYPSFCFSSDQNILNNCRTLLLKENYSSAVSCYTNIIKQTTGKDLASAYYWRGKSYEGLNFYNKAIEDIIASLRINPNRNKSYKNLGLLYEKTFNYHNAIKAYTIGIEKFPKYKALYLLRSEAFIKIGRPDKAAIDYKTYKSIN